MSESDGFIDEVTDELRRDRLFAAMRRWAPVAVLVILLIVGGTAWNEWRKARDQTAMQARGDALAAAIDGGDPARLREAAGDGPVALLLAGGAGDVGALRALAADPAQPALYRDLAAIRLADAAPGDPMVDDLLLSAAAPGAPYRLLAEERLAYADAAAGNPATALTRLQAILVDAEASADLRTRAAQAIVALGGTPEGL
ncbi:hypothetical protein BCF33_1036 [Hasllibacter halocynthiae]|uniref:Tetratricopeptide repeat-like domain-containing protein n=1 Tax=Hasllibacter halocynthiae TaxID=595589 RepID=A0A2T0X921_9RHOB|nr:hypothetical protein [Hasllibacter halocynthiae]PRY95417.1 hypothetical protein BCF33_1036 [Hasllibacter halocynthiae]